ncbi:MAG: dihydropteroate synthase [Pyrinomonadaceae bacterium]
MNTVNKIWRTSRRDLDYGDSSLVMAIMNVTPDSFSDGGKFASIGDVLRQAEKFVVEGADIIDVGGESSRPGSSRVSIEEETYRVVPVIEAIATRLDIPISVDTSKAEVAARALAAGAEIINDISGLRFDDGIAETAAAQGAGLVLMHSRGDFEEMHTQPSVPDILLDVEDAFRAAIAKARSFGVADESIALDVGIGFGKTRDQNLELIAKLGKLTAEFRDYPMLIGTSRKSFIGKLLNDEPVNERLSGSIATAAIAVWNGASILRVHDVKETVELTRIVGALRDQL